MKRIVLTLAMAVTLCSIGSVALANGPHHHHHHGGGPAFRATFFGGPYPYPAYRPYYGPAYYPPPVAYYPAPMYAPPVYAAPVYPVPAPVYPAPVYGPAVSLSIGR